jgi:hypothetical protein
MYDRLKFVVYDKAKPDIENIVSLNLAAAEGRIFNNMLYV